MLLESKNNKNLLNITVEKHDFHRSKEPIDINHVNIPSILFSKK